MYACMKRLIKDRIESLNVELQLDEFVAKDVLFGSENARLSISKHSHVKP